ncbi:uncharacterized protein GIQ15_04315 [Arthroderma uncinatum]|uniref:uncharacterized protein n=1 Tax=Arthroderma uncinatum TaxID=74035 RepID=UPI00144ABDCF|nr:uncharacterized protein GIQ15_04315 [Arthroderma uncinatum]KAF3481556.1 hypothetical protein GIQ15_04315 [Arthroderma uncinatum]
MAKEMATDIRGTGPPPIAVASSLRRPGDCDNARRESGSDVQLLESPQPHSQMDPHRYAMALILFAKLSGIVELSESAVSESNLAGLQSRSPGDSEHFILTRGRRPPNAAREFRADNPVGGNSRPVALYHGGERSPCVNWNMRTYRTTNSAPDPGGSLTRCPLVGLADPAGSSDTGELQSPPSRTMCRDMKRYAVSWGIPDELAQLYSSSVVRLFAGACRMMAICSPGLVDVVTDTLHPLSSKMPGPLPALAAALFDIVKGWPERFDTADAASLVPRGMEVFGYFPPLLTVDRKYTRTMLQAGRLLALVLGRKKRWSTVKRVSLENFRLNAKRLEPQALRLRGFVPRDVRGALLRVFRRYRGRRLLNRRSGHLASDSGCLTPPGEAGCSPNGWAELAQITQSAAHGLGAHGSSKTLGGRSRVVETDGASSINVRQRGAGRKLCMPSPNAASRHLAPERAGPAVGMAGKVAAGYS